MTKKIKLAIIAALGLILFSVLPSIGMAAEHKTEKVKSEGEEKNVLKIDKMVVTSRKIEERLSAELAEYGHKVEIVTSEDISRGGFTVVKNMAYGFIPFLSFWI